MISYRSLLLSTIILYDIEQNQLPLIILYTVACIVAKLENPTIEQYHGKLPILTQVYSYAHKYHDI